MAYDDKLADRIRKALTDFPDIKEKEKMGRLSFTLNGKMCVRVNNNDMMIRCQPEMTEELLYKKGQGVMK